MPGRKRTAKSLGLRHDLNYFKKWNPFREWKLGLTAVLILLVVAWLGAQGARGRSSPFSAGPLSSAHAFFGNQCALCHTSVTSSGLRGAGFREHVPDSACLSCHQAPAHHPTETEFTPSCGSCHREHTGLLQLAHTPSVSCAQCHGDLRLAHGETRILTHITSFNRDHPEFAVLRRPGLDPGTIAFNHALHLTGQILGPGARPVQLVCGDCHRPAPDAAGGWKYGTPELERAAYSPESAAEKQMPSGEVTNLHFGRELMAPITYDRNCIACHALQFDARFAESVPHKTPEIVHAFVVEKFKQYLAKNPSAWRQPSPAAAPTRELPGYARLAGATAIPPAPQAHSPEEWLRMQVSQAEGLLWRKTCRQCHQLSYASSAADALPRVAPANITLRWLPRSVFSHEAHRAISCVGCHSAAPASHDTADVLVPSIKTCQSCHNGLPTSYGHAENRCFECHEYHNWRARKGFEGNYSLDKLLGRLRAPAPAAAPGTEAQAARQRADARPSSLSAWLAALR